MPSLNPKPIARSQPQFTQPNKKREPIIYSAQGLVCGRLELGRIVEDTEISEMRLFSSYGGWVTVKITIAPTLARWIAKPENVHIRNQWHLWRCYPRAVKLSRKGQNGQRITMLLLFVFALEKELNAFDMTDILNAMTDDATTMEITGIIKGISVHHSLINVYVPRNLGSSGNFFAGSLPIYVDDKMLHAAREGCAVRVSAQMDGVKINARTLQLLGTPAPHRSSSLAKG